MSFDMEEFKKMLKEAMEAVVGEEETISPLPEPTVTLVALDAATLSGSDIMGVLHNPIFAGVTPFPTIISDETWIATAAGLIKEEGEVLFLVNLLKMLRESYKSVYPIIGEPIVLKADVNADVAL
ncbi:MAG: hypothetical protein WC455_09005 [Dehalococcoidia bacterium]